MLTKRSFSYLLVATLLLALVATSCAPAATPTAAPPPTKVPGAEFNQYPGVTINVSRWAGNPWEGTMRELGNEWGQMTGATVNIDAIPYENRHE